MVTILLFLLVLSISCSSNSTTQSQQPLVFSLFSPYIHDMGKAVSVIQKHELIGTLTHLMSMDNGGRTYYLLEYEQINEMLSNVTEKLYEDVIIINTSYHILFSMKNLSFYGRRISDISPVLYYFITTIDYNDVSIYKPFEFPALSGNYSFAILYPIYLNERNKGFLIGIINHRKLYEVLPDDSLIADKNGEVFFNLANQDTLKIDEKNLHAQSVTLQHKTYRIKPLQYKNIFWYILYP